MAAADLDDGLDDLEDFGEKSELDEQFTEATLYVRKKANEISKDTLLYLYARFKFVNDGPCTQPRPSGIFNFEAKSKWDSYNTLSKSSITKRDAQEEYIRKLDNVVTGWREESKNENNNNNNAADRAGTFGIKLSTMNHFEGEHKIAESDKDAFDFVKDNSIDKLKAFIETKGSHFDKNVKDEQGMTLLMWSCDLGLLHMVKYLVDTLDTDVNLQDNDGQTCLHYAVASERVDIVSFLASLPSMKIELGDDDDAKPIDLTDNQEIVAILSKKE